MSLAWTRPPGHALTDLPHDPPHGLPHRRPVDAAAAGSRLDVFLVQQQEVTSRAHAKKLVQQGKVQVNGKLGKAGQTLTAGQVVAFDPVLEQEPADRALAPAAPLAVVHEDDYILVVQKPAGVSSHPAAAGRAGETTMVDLATAHCRSAGHQADYRTTLGGQRGDSD